MSRAVLKFARQALLIGLAMRLGLLFKVGADD
jgi:hypothetical protein